MHHTKEELTKARKTDHAGHQEAPLAAFFMHKKIFKNNFILHIISEKKQGLNPRSSHDSIHPGRNNPGYAKEKSGGKER